MERKLEQLKAWGCDVDGAMGRVLDDEELLLSCIEQVAVDPAFASLGTALAAGDVANAFDAAHTLKGIIANTGITPLYDIVVRIVEPLRAGKADGTQQAYTELLAKCEELKALLAQA